MLKSKLDVLVISGAYPPEGGGVAAHVYYLAYALSRLRRARFSPHRICNVHVLTTGEYRKSEGIPPNLTIHRVTGKNRHFISAGDVPYEEAVRYAMNHWQKLRPDVIHAHDFESLQIGLMLKVAFSIPLVLTVHKVPKEWDSTLPQRDVKDCFLQLIRNFELADKVVAPSRAYRQRLLDQGFPDQNIELIHHGVPVRWLSSWANKDGVLQRLNLDNSHELILCPARLDPHKGIETFVDAAAIIKNRFRNRSLLFAIAGAGSTEYRSDIEHRAQTRLVGTVLRCGPSDNKDFDHKEMPTLYRRAKICVLPSRREGLGQVLLEAFVFKRPVVAANTGGIPDVVIPGVTGLLFNRDEPDDLAHQINTLLEDEGLSQYLTFKAYERLCREFDADRMAEAYSRLYKRVAGIRIK